MMSTIGVSVLESQDPEVEQHISSTHGPTTKGQAKTKPTDTTKQERVSLHDPTKLAHYVSTIPWTTTTLLAHN
jgi:hypothetical protein